MWVEDMKHSVYRLLVILVMFIVLSSLTALAAAQDDEPEGGRALNAACPDEENLGRLLDALRAEHPGYENPPIHGLLWHRTERFSFFVPIDWQRSDWDDGRTGVLYYPVLDDPQTVFAVETKDLGKVISSEDLDRLDAGFIDTIEQLPEGEIESHDKAVIGEQMQLECKYTFREGCVMRRRWVRVFFLGTRETIMTAQGSTLDLYDYWLPWFFEAMATAQVHDQKPTIASLG
jgi:hypothetical protein